MTSVEQVACRRLRADDARRAGAPSLAALKRRWRRGPTTRPGASGWRTPVPTRARRCGPPCRTPPRSPPINARLDRLDAASSSGPWTRETLDLIDLNGGVRAPELAAQVGRETQDFKKDVRKLKELGLTESLAIGYLLSPRGEAVVDAGAPVAARARAARGGDAAPADDRGARHPRAAGGRA